jgi:hypothetical protein
MKRWVIGATFLAAASTAALAQPARELTLFSNPGFSGARYTVTGPRENLAIPFQPRSAMLQGGGSWELCPSRSYGGRCQTIRQNQRDLRLDFVRVQSARPARAVVQPPPPVSNWREIARLAVRDRIETETVNVRDTIRFREVKVCGQRQIVRMRRAEVLVQSGRWQRLPLPPVLSPGRCSNPLALPGANGQRVRALRFTYEAWTLQPRRGGTIVVQGLPFVRPQPR